MEKLRLSEIAGYCSARISGADPETIVTGISTDSRKIRAGELFVALIGEKMDGHDYIGQARCAGAAAVLSSKEGDDPGTLYVEDTLRALADIAAGYRRRFVHLKVTAITGSVGKTTTKEMIAAVLSRFGPTLKTEGNFNNEIGLPLSVLRIGSEHRAAVFEMGMNHFGEIARMTRVASPDIAVITNIGVAHIEYLGSREGIRKAKLEIAEGLNPEGTLILNGDEPLLWELRGKLPYKTLYFGIRNPECDIKADLIRGGNGTRGEETLFRVQIGSVRFDVRLPATGTHNVMNALAAASVGYAYSRRNGRSDAESAAYAGRRIAAGLLKFSPPPMRQNIIRTKGYTVIDDCYNANPDSMAAALTVLHSIGTPGKRIAVLGDMLELGAFSEQAHRTLGETAAEAADYILLTGKEVEHTLRGAVSKGKRGYEVQIYQTKEKLAEELRELAKPGDVILFKGSRGMMLDQARDMFLGENRP